MATHTTDTVNALGRIDDAIVAIEDARALLADRPTFVGASPNGEGLIGQAVDDLRVLRGRVADPSLHDH